MADSAFPGDLAVNRYYCELLSQADLPQQLDYASVLAQLSEAGVHLQFRDGKIMVLGSLL